MSSAYLIRSGFTLTVDEYKHIRVARIKMCKDIREETNVIVINQLFIANSKME